MMYEDSDHDKEEAISTAISLAIWAVTVMAVFGIVLYLLFGT